MVQTTPSQIDPPLRNILAFRLEERDSMHFEYFRHVGVKEFGVYFAVDDGGDGDGFWEKILFRAVQREPFVLHTVLALAAFGRERYHPSNFNQAKETYPVTEYNTAIRLLNERLCCFDDQVGGLELAVLGTNLFVAVEMFWSRVPRVEGLLKGMCDVLRGSERTRDYFPMMGSEVGWMDFRCEGNEELERLLGGLAAVARQIAWFRSFEGAKERSVEEEM